MSEEQPDYQEVEKLQRRLGIFTFTDNRQCSKACLQTPGCERRMAEKPGRDLHLAGLYLDGVGRVSVIL